LHTLVLFYENIYNKKEMVRKDNTNIDIKDLQNQIKKLTIKVNTLEKNVINVNKKGKSNKDPNAPKRNVNCYIHFYNVFFKEYLSKNPGVNASNVGKIAGEEWNKIKEDPKKKKKYDDMAVKDKKRYEKEIIEYRK
jgi:flagellar hook assembly protein FlgD